MWFITHSAVDKVRRFKTNFRDSKVMLLSLFTGICLAACSSMPPQEFPKTQTLSAQLGTSRPAAAIASQGTPPDDQNKQSSTKPVKITPFTSISHRFGSYANPAFSGAYTRLIIDANNTMAANNDATRGEEYSYNDRGLMARFFWGRLYSINLTANVRVGDFIATVPLATIEHISNRNDGEKFSRFVSHRAQDFPLFLVKGDGSNNIVSVKFAVKATDQEQAALGAVTLNLAQAVVKAVVPQSSVLTTLSAQTTKDVASSLDNMISALFSRSIDEKQAIEHDLRQWDQGVNASFNIPFPANGTSLEDIYASVRPLGTWTVRFEEPRPSVFSNIQICPKQQDPDQPTGCLADMDAAVKQAQADALKRPHEVLAFKLFQGAQKSGTVLSHLRHQDWWDSTFNRLSTKGDVSDEEVRGFCRAIKNTIVDLNLNNIDAGIVTVAVSKAAVLPKGVPEKMQALESGECTVSYP